MDIYAKKPVEYWRYSEMRATVVLSPEGSIAIGATEEYGGMLLAALRNKPGFMGQLQDAGKN